MNDLTKYLIGVAIGIFIGLLVYEKFLKEEFEDTTTITEKETIDTAFNEVSERLVFDSLLYQSLTDSIDFYRRLYSKDLSKDNITIIPEGEPIQAPLRRYQGFKPTLYGNIGYDALIVGSLMEMEIQHDMRMPTINHRIEREVTTIKVQKPSGIYATGGINSNFNYSLGATYLKDKSLIGYEYQPQVQTHSLKIGVKLF